MLNNLFPAMYFGLMVQLIWLSTLPIGAAKTPEGNIGSIIGCILYVQNIEVFSENGKLLLLITFLITVAGSYTASRLESFDRRINIRLFDRNSRELGSNHKTAFGLTILFSIGVQLLFNWAMIFSWVVLGNIFLDFIPGENLITYNFIWQYIDMAILGIGIGMLISIYKKKNIKKIITLLSLIFILLFKFV